MTDQSHILQKHYSLPRLIARFPEFYDAMKKNGSPVPHFETDDERTYFLAVLPVHPEVKKRGDVGGHAPKISLNDTESHFRAFRKGAKIGGRTGQ